MRRNKIKIPRSCTHKFRTGILYEVDYAGGKYIFILPTIPILKQNLFGFMVITDKNRDHIPNVEVDYIMSAMPITLPDGTEGYIDLLNIHVLSFNDMDKASSIGAIGDAYDPRTMKIIPRSLIIRYLADAYKSAVGCGGYCNSDLNMPSVSIGVNTKISAGPRTNLIVESAIVKCQSTNDNGVNKRHIVPFNFNPPITNDNGVITYDGVRIRSRLDSDARTWSDSEIGYFLYKYSDSNNRDAMAAELGGSAEQLKSKYSEVIHEYKLRKDRNHWGFIK
jgi:hypothetical protein